MFDIIYFDDWKGQLKIENIYNKLKMSLEKFWPSMVEIEEQQKVQTKKTRKLCFWAQIGIITI